MRQQSTLAPCLQYIVSLTSDLTPIPGTLRGIQNIHSVPSCDHKIATVYPYQIPFTEKCRPATGLRYFYLVNSRTQKIVPNSMIALTHKPKNMCTGVNSYLEFIVKQTVR